MGPKIPLHFKKSMALCGRSRGGSRGFNVREQENRQRWLSDSCQTAGPLSREGPRLFLMGSLRSWGLCSDGPGIHGKISWEACLAPEFRSEYALYPHNCSQVPRLPRGVSQAHPGSHGIPGQTSLDSGPPHFSSLPVTKPGGQKEGRAPSSLACKKNFPKRLLSHLPCSHLEHSSWPSMGSGASLSKFTSWLCHLLAG